MGKFIKREGYMHLSAKKILTDKLRIMNNTQKICSTNSFCWRSGYGVFDELPFYETSSPYYFEHSVGLKYEWDETRTDNPITWFEDYYDMGKIIFVPDITIFESGQAKILIEVVSTNPVSFEKKIKMVNFFGSLHFEVYEVSAKDVLNRNIRCNFERIL